MKFISTRGNPESISSAEAILKGLAPDGGLYVPEAIPTLTDGEIREMLPLDYPSLSARILSKWLTDFSEEKLLSLTRAAYARFSTEEVVPVKALQRNRYALELFHGPTLAFKDVALTLLPYLMRESAKLMGETRKIMILVATSGDTGKAALEGFRDVEGTAVTVFYPHGAVSKAQYLQMATQEGNNTKVIAVKGNFDDAQTGVKRIFSDEAYKQLLSDKGVVLSSANSINLGRLVPQIAYYFWGYLDAARKGTIRMGDRVNICVPTGNFGNILAAYYAKAMGLPVAKLVCASNDNNVLTDFIQTGVYDKNRSFHVTISPSMDILISSNLERLLFELTGRDSERVRDLMRQLSESGKYALSNEEKRKMDAFLYGSWANEDTVRTEIASVFEKEGYLIDPHTAVAFAAVEAYRSQTGDGAPMFIASTASPYKFGRAMAQSLHLAAEDDFACCEKVAALAKQEVPASIRDLTKKPVLHTTVCEKEEMQKALSDII